ncbi:hypothetical protein KEM60_01386 [Austwickia sp. TVS 96-490-7B]|uniref:TetR/AcrR family transcriptional regulator n=1 Tax=Austwickia sp. TVS 96-490-7B TaxID=2830843 RepID=UPI001C56E462|nr:TetR/AcrR family transcriptional regulator [Austwickia sp. TVS 96-490-7B]MBW3085189.1 hypothetical protein [Austwickia sp. TVS 96-490-7B]
MPKIEAPTVAEHRAMRRRAVVDNAVALLVAEGPAALTPAAVAKMTGLARTSVYQYFPTGGDLLGAAIEHLFVASQAGLTAALDGAGGDIDDRIAAYVRATLETARRGHHPTRLVGVELPAACRARLKELHDEVSRPLRDIVIASEASDVDTTTALAQGVINGAVILVEHGADLEHTADETVLFLQRALSRA